MAGIAAAIIGSGVLGAGASLLASNKQSQAANNAINEQNYMFQLARQTSQPFIDVGKGAGDTLSKLLTPGANMTDIISSVPGFDFLNKITQRGVSNQGTVTGLGGNTLLAGANAGTNIALSQGWQPIVNALQGLFQTGAGTASALGGQAVQAGSGIASNMVGIGNAQGGALTSGASSIGNALTTAALFQKLFNGNGGMYSNGTIGGTNPLGGSESAVS